MTKQQDFNSAPFLRRIIAFVLDIFAVYVLRVFLAQALILLWLKKYVILFYHDFEFVFNKSFHLTELNSIHISFIKQHELFSKGLIFIFCIMTIGFIYNFLFLRSRLSATLGQRIMRLFVITKKKKQKLTFLPALSRSFFACLPWLIIFTTLAYQTIANIGFMAPLLRQVFLGLVFGVMIIWYDSFFITKDLLLMHDIITKTRLVTGVANTGKKNSLLKSLFPNFKEMFLNIKSFTKQNLEQVKKIKEDYKKEKGKGKGKGKDKRKKK